jgi:hypothetical protein
MNTCPICFIRQLAINASTERLARLILISGYSRVSKEPVQRSHVTCHSKGEKRHTMTVRPLAGVCTPTMFSTASSGFYWLRMPLLAFSSIQRQWDVQYIYIGPLHAFQSNPLISDEMKQLHNQYPCGFPGCNKAFGCQGSADRHSRDKHGTSQAVLVFAETGVAI